MNNVFTNLTESDARYWRAFTAGDFGFVTETGDRLEAKLGRYGIQIWRAEEVR